MQPCNSSYFKRVSFFNSGSTICFEKNYKRLNWLNVVLFETAVSVERLCCRSPLPDLTDQISPGNIQLAKERQIGPEVRSKATDCDLFLVCIHTFGNA